LQFKEKNSQTQCSYESIVHTEKTQKTEDAETNPEVDFISHKARTPFTFPKKETKNKAQLHNAPPIP